MSESNNNTPMRITQLQEATAYEDGMYYAVAKAGSGTKKINADTIPTNTNSVINNLSKSFIPFDVSFVRGGLSNQGTINSETHRITSENIISFDYPIYIKIFDDNFRYGLAFYDSEGTYVVNNMNMTYSYYIKPNTKFRICIYKRNEVASPANIDFFKTRVLHQTQNSLYTEKVLQNYDQNTLQKYFSLRFEYANYSNGKFVFGGYNAITEPTKFPFDIVVTNEDSSLYQFNIKKWTSDEVSSSTYIGTSGWIDSSYRVPANTFFTVEFASKSSSIPRPTPDGMSEVLTFTGEGMIEEFNLSELQAAFERLDYKPTSYADYLKTYITYTMVHKYYTNGQIINAPKYYCNVAIKRLPVGVYVSFNDSNVTFKVSYFNNDNEIAFSETSWNNDSKYIEANTYFMISAQLNSEISLDDWYNKIVITTDSDIINQNNDFYLPKLNYSVNYGNPERFQLLWFSDIHAAKDDLKRIIQYINAQNGKLSDSICTGDMVSDKFSDSFTFWDDLGAGDILTIIGNHDGRTGDSSTPWESNQNMFNKFFAPYIDNWGVTYENNYCNWYKIYNSKIMLIGLCCVNATEAEETTMLSFLQNALDVASLNNYAVVIAHHYPLDPQVATNYETPFNTIGRISRDLFIPQSVINKVKSFKANGGEFVCYLTGHTHYDKSQYVTNENQIVLTVASAAYLQGIQSNSTIRTATGKFRDLFNIFSVDTTNKILSIQRIGSNCDVWFRKLDSLVMNYETGEILH